MIKRFGFQILSEEQDNGKFVERNWFSIYPYWEDKKQLIKFIEVEMNTPRYPDMAYCSMYYKRYMARTEIIPLETLKNIFPKSFKEGNAGIEYDLAFPQERWAND